MDQAATLRTLREKEQNSAGSTTGNLIVPRGYPLRHGNQVDIGNKRKRRCRQNKYCSQSGIFSCRKNQRTMILDADAGLANIDVILGINSPYNLYHVLNGERTLAEALVEGPGGIKILPSASGIPEMTDLSRGQKLTLIDELNALNDSLDFMLIDTGAGISANVMYFNMAAKEIIVVTSPEPTALTDAYALIKVLYQRHAKRRFRLIVNMVQ